MTIQRVGFAETQSMIRDGNAVYLDVRSVPEFEQGHPQGAYNIPLLHMAGGSRTVNANFVAEVERAFAKDQTIVLGCRSGGRSAQAAQALASRGFQNLVDYAGGWAGSAEDPGWVASGGPTTTEGQSGRTYEDLKL